MIRRRSCLATALAVLAAALVTVQPLAAQGTGKGGGGNDRDERRESRGRAAGQEGRGAGRAGGPETRGRRSLEDRAARAETHADQRIERRLEREFAGDVDLPGRGRALGRTRGAGRYARQVNVSDIHPTLRRLIEADHAPARAAVGAVARAHMRGLGRDALRIQPAGDRVRISNNDGMVLVELDDRVRDLGRWEVVPLDDQVSEGAPSFCRTGEGHPVFGRQWCIDKRFGLGNDGDFRWGRTERITDLVFQGSPRTRTAVLSRDALLAALGAVAFDRLALHAITLGLTDPLTGRWVAPQEPGAARVLLVSSGARPIAEVVDVDRDERADLIVVALRAW